MGVNLGAGILAVRQAGNLAVIRASSEQSATYELIDANTFENAENLGIIDNLSEPHLNLNLSEDLELAREYSLFELSSGMRDTHAQNLSYFSKGNSKGDELLIIIRASNADSLPYHFDAVDEMGNLIRHQEDYVSKPYQVKLKTGKVNHKGLVVWPEVDFMDDPARQGILKEIKANEETSAFPEGTPIKPGDQQNIVQLVDSGHTFDKDGILVNKYGQRIHGDYDIQGIYQKKSFEEFTTVEEKDYLRMLGYQLTETDGKITGVTYANEPIKSPFYVQVDTNARSFIEKINKQVTPDRIMFQHGGNDFFSSESREKFCTTRKMVRHSWVAIQMIPDYLGIKMKALL
ncbi:MAG: hypothetical protein HC877_24420 [Thioploca sp.]|nr:hypothetical protein [Thioploca sp.]